MAAEVITSVQSLPPNAYNGMLATSQQSLPPRTGRVRVAVQQPPPPPPQTPRVQAMPPTSQGRVNLNA